GGSIHPPVASDKVRPLRVPGGIETNRPSSEDRSSTLVRRPGLSCGAGLSTDATRGITVAGQRRIHTGFAGLNVIPARVRDKPDTTARLSFDARSAVCRLAECREPLAGVTRYYSEASSRA